jgi:hypothetical protein
MPPLFACLTGNGIGNALKEFLDRLSSYDHGSAHHHLLSKRQEGTGMWILQNAEFTKWWESTSASIWCSGIRMHSSALYCLQIRAYDQQLSGSGKDDTDVRYA